MLLKASTRIATPDCKAEGHIFPTVVLLCLEESHSHTWINKSPSGSNRFPVTKEPQAAAYRPQQLRGNYKIFSRVSLSSRTNKSTMLQRKLHARLCKTYPIYIYRSDPLDPEMTNARLDVFQPTIYRGGPSLKPFGENRDKTLSQNRRAHRVWLVSSGIYVKFGNNPPERFRYPRPPDAKSN